MVDQKLRKYGLEKVYENLLLHLSLFVGECDSRYNSPGHWQLEKEKDNSSPNLIYVNSKGQKSNIMGTIAKNILEENVLYTQIQVALVAQPYFDVSPEGWELIKKSRKLPPKDSIH